MRRLVEIAERWKYPSILLFGIGLSNVGAWIYFIALNLIVLDMTKSPLALSILYIIRPVAGLVANVWAGSVVDRMNKKHIMVVLDVFRALLLCILPFTDSIWIIYSVTLIVKIASHVFGNASFIYITQLIPEEQRPRFNSLNSLLSSGAFLIGPAIAGLLFLIGTPGFAIMMNAAALFVSGMITTIMPNVDSERFRTASSQPLLSLSVLKEDFVTVRAFYRTNRSVMAMCMLFGGLMVVMASSVDSLEAAFATIELGLLGSEYGMLVSIAGAGIVAGAVLNTLIVNKLTPFSLIGMGVMGNCLGYCIYAFSYTYFSASVGFFVLAFFLAFANTGFMTFYQKNVPIEIMGRVGSLNGLIESVLTIIITFLFGIWAEAVTLRPVVVSGVFIMLLLGVMIATLSAKLSAKPMEA